MNGLRTTIGRRTLLAATSTGAAVLPFGWALPAAAQTRKKDSFSFGREIKFDAGWRFFRGSGEGLEQPAVDDSAWRGVDLPHDWSVEDIPGGSVGPFDPKAEGGFSTGFTVGGEGWYRRHFNGTSLPADALVEIMFDGVYMENDVWLNGHHLGRNVGGYTAFAYNLTPHLNRSGANVIAVHVRNFGRNSRWYSGSGIYRSVTLNVLRSASQVKRNGVGAWTRSLKNGRAEIEVTTKLMASDPAQTLVTRLIDEGGKTVAEARSGAAAEVKHHLAVERARLWSAEDPQLYTLVSELRWGKAVIDKVRQAFGVRVVSFDAARGMAINGKVVKLRGGCVHHDNGLLGACAFPDADDRRIRLLKARGFNAIRSSHNPISRSLRDACDRIGMYVIDEAFDAWTSAKNPQDFAVSFKDHWQDVVDAMVLGARNSPSLIMWSIGNEIPERPTAEGIEWQWKLANAIRTLDPSRPVTAGINGLLGPRVKASDESAVEGRAGELDNASTVFLDVLGYNYRLADIEAEQIANPRRVSYASETYASEAWDYAELAKRAPYFLGEFVWTAMDYLGEAGIGRAEHRPSGKPLDVWASYPWVNAYCGDVDLIGDQKASSRYRDVVWGLSALEIAVQRPVPDGMAEKVSGWGWSDELQSWTWPEKKGTPLAVRIYSSADRVDLLLNGAQVGTKTLAYGDKMRTEFSVPYADGILEAVAYQDGSEIARKRLVTVSAPARLQIRVEKPTAGPRPPELHYVALDIVDAEGRLVPDAKKRIGLKVHGPAELIGFGSANPFAVGSLQASSAESFHGCALAILRSRSGKGAVRIEATSEGIAGAATVLRFG